MGHYHQENIAKFREMRQELVDMLATVDLVLAQPDVDPGGLESEIRKPFANFQFYLTHFNFLLFGLGRTGT